MDATQIAEVRLVRDRLAENIHNGKDLPLSDQAELLKYLTPLLGRVFALEQHLSTAARLSHGARLGNDVTYEQVVDSLQRHLDTDPGVSEV